MTSNHSMASKIHNCDVLYIQKGFAAISSFCDLKKFGGLNSLRGHYDLNDLDRERLIKGLRYGAEIWLDGAGAERIVPALFGTDWCHTLEEAHALLTPDLDVGRLSLYSSHPQASCRVGRACDETGKVNGTKRIYAMDSSAMPSNVGRNPQISIMTVARTLAERFVNVHGGLIQPILR